MGGILDKLDEWLRGLLIEGITGNLSDMFDTVNTKVGEIAGEVGQTPLNWNSGVFSMIRNLSETVIVPIAGVILTFVMCYELIQLAIETLPSISPSTNTTIWSGDFGCFHFKLCKNRLCSMLNSSMFTHTRRQSLPVKIAKAK